ncbi:2,3-bisphosphoglycerate-independent phosphoglycerate mutase [Chloroflexota bacterium]
MVDLNLISELSRISPSKIVLVVIDGLGGLPHPETGKTELEVAVTPNLDRLAARGVCGLADIVSPGITPGSTPGHLAVFGYDPLRYNIGRGVLETAGIGFDIKPGDVATRGNFCTVDKAGLITDRRAGRISTEKGAELCAMLDKIRLEGVELSVCPVIDHRFVVVFRGEDLYADVTDSDPQQTEVAPEEIRALQSRAEKAARISNQFIAQARKILADKPVANMILLRGFSGKPEFPSLGDVYRLTPAAIAVYPMYRGLSGLMGMKVLETGPSIEEEFITLKQHYNNFDFFFFHVKGTDSAGEDGDYDRKVAVIEEFDGALSSLMGLNPDVIVVTGDHSSPATFRGHSWHPVPTLLYSRWCRPDKVSGFSEFACLGGGLGRFPATQIMPLAMANALKLTKFGA